MKYTKILSRTRVVTENSFGLLKGRFRRLPYVDAEIGVIYNTVLACCMLYNITLDFPEEEMTLLQKGPLPIEKIIWPTAEIGRLHDTTAADTRRFIALIL